MTVVNNPSIAGIPPPTSNIWVRIFKKPVAPSINPPNKSELRNVVDIVWKELVKPSIFNIFNEDRNSSPVVSYKYVSYAISLNFHFSFLDDFAFPWATRYISERLDTESFSASYIVSYEQI